MYLYPLGCWFKSHRCIFQFKYKYGIVFIALFFNYVITYFLPVKVYWSPWSLVDSAGLSPGRLWWNLADSARLHGLRRTLADWTYKVGPCHTNTIQGLSPPESTGVRWSLAESAGIRRSRWGSVQSSHHLTSIRKIWHARWKRSPRYESISLIDNILLSNQYLKLIDPLDRQQSAILTQLRTGHIPLNQHLF